MIEDERVSVFGIRHHGPGSARSLLAALQKLQPDCILIEGPPDANDILFYVSDEQMKAPVSLLICAQDNPREAAYYPFAEFSPEWQAIKYGLANSIPVRFMDLPQCHWMALRQADEIKSSSEHSLEEKETESIAQGEGDFETAIGIKVENKSETEVDETELWKRGENPEQFGSSSKAPNPAATNIIRDPLSYLSAAAGYEDSERWWENLVEQRRDDLEVFAAINKAMSVLRDELAASEVPQHQYEALREAQMRQTIRNALKDGYKKIAAVCGAWHAPALQKMPSAGHDRSLLKALPKIKVHATWIPWTHRRLAFSSGYGAGVESPGWYEHLWKARELPAEQWIARAARLLREEDLDASAAQVVDAVRLSEALASMRGRSLPGLEELSESIETVFCFGNPLPVKLIHEKLSVGDAMGELPPESPGTPLQKDLEKEQKRLRLPMQAGEKLYDLDLRKATDLSRSHLLHRLEILDIPWGRKQEAVGKSGTFHEIWILQWKPEFALSIIESSFWGKTVFEAATAFACDQSETETELMKLAELLDSALLADLPSAIDRIMNRIENEAALAVDIRHLMKALPSLAQIARYGNVRKTESAQVNKVIDGMAKRICIGLPAACSCTDESAGRELFELILKVNSALNLLQNRNYDSDWLEVLAKLSDARGINSLIAGRAVRLLFDKKKIDAKEAARRLGFSLSTAGEASLAADWAEGFLLGSGLILIHDEELLKVVDQWVGQLSDDDFRTILPLLRRTFSTFAPLERRQIGERVARDNAANEPASKLQRSARLIDEARGRAALPVVLLLLGLSRTEMSEVNQHD